MRPSLLLAALLIPLLGCTPHRIPGTEIEDTSDTRAILGVMEKYRRAVETKDANALVGLLADSFKDDGGSGTPEDDLDYQTVREKLPARMARLEDVRLNLEIRKIEVHPDDTASAVYHYSESWKMPSLSSKPFSGTEIKQMWFKRVGEQWKIASGI